jgi:hypothetical protein
MLERYLMVFKNVGKAWRIWGLPLLVFVCSEIALLMAFDFVVSKDEANLDLWENGILGSLIITCWFIAAQFEKIERIPIRKWTKRCLKLFSIIYVVSLLVTMILKVCIYAFDHYIG